MSELCCWHGIIRAMNEQQRAELELKLAQAQLSTVEALLAIKTVRWYEVIVFGGAGIAVGLGLAKVFLIS